MTQLRSVTCHKGSHSVTCYPSPVNAPRLHPSQTGWYSIYRPFNGGGLSKPRPGCKEQLAHGCYTTARRQLASNPPPSGSKSSVLTTKLSSNPDKKISRQTQIQNFHEMFRTSRIDNVEFVIFTSVITRAGKTRFLENVLRFLKGSIRF